MFEQYIIGERGSIPFAAAAELHHTLTAGPRQVLTKEASLGRLKILQIMKTAQSPEEAQDMLQQQAMTDPNVVAALDQQELMNENQALGETVQLLQEQVAQTQQAQAMSDQTAQQATQQMEQQGALLQQAQADRAAAQQEAVAARDAQMQEQVASQQNRMQLMQAADQLSLQLKQVAAQPTASEAQMQAEQGAAPVPPPGAGAEQAPVEGAPPEEQAPPSAKTQKEETEAVNAQDEAQKQTAQAEQSKQQDAAKVQVTMPKQGSDRVAQVVHMLKLARARREMRKTAGILEKIPIQTLYAAGLGAVGAGKAGLEQAIHKQRYGEGKPSNKELELAGELHTAKMKEKREPNYVNKFRVKQLEYRLGMEKADREHPGGAMARGAFQGAVIGGLAGPSIHNLGKRGIEYIKHMQGLRAQQAALEAFERVMGGAR